MVRDGVGPAFMCQRCGFDLTDAVRPVTRFLSPARKRRANYLEV